jgi:AbrB family looped-hinge helix DNA binding protein
MEDAQEGEIVSVTEEGQATIPKKLRERRGISAPGLVKFVETEEGEIVVRPIAVSDLRGALRDPECTGEEQRSATELLHESRKQDKERIEKFMDRYGDADSGDR